MIDTIDAAVPARQFSEASAFGSWCRGLLAVLEDGTPETPATIIPPAYNLMYEVRDLPLRICRWLERDLCTPQFEIDTQSNPLQVVLARTPKWRFLMYVWCPRPYSSQRSKIAHDHSSTGFSLIHTGSCYVEREFAVSADGTHQQVRTFSPQPGQRRTIEPSLFHTVDVTNHGGFSFIIWGPRQKATTTTLDLEQGTIQKLPSEHVDRVGQLLEAIRSPLFAPIAGSP